MSQVADVCTLSSVSVKSRVIQYLITALQYLMIIVIALCVEVSNEEECSYHTDKCTPIPLCTVMGCHYSISCTQIVLLLVRSTMKSRLTVQRLVLILISCVLVRVNLVAPVQQDK